MRLVPLRAVGEEGEKRMEIGKIKAKARDSLEHRLFGNVWITLLVCNLVYSVVVGLPSTISSAVTRLSVAAGTALGVPLGLVGLVVAGPMAYGLSRVFHKVALGNKKIDIAELFCGFKEDLGETFLLGLLRTIFLFLWSLLLIVPGIIMSYAYSMAFYIQQDSADKNWRACLDESKELTRGYKGKLFLMDLSFIGWYIVGALCLGVGILWVDVYHSQARAEFYEELKKIKAAEFGDTAEEEPENAGSSDPFEELTDAPAEPKEQASPAEGGAPAPETEDGE